MTDLIYPKLKDNRALIYSYVKGRDQLWIVLILSSDLGFKLLETEG